VELDEFLSASIEVLEAPTIQFFAFLFWRKIPGLDEPAEPKNW
jgi:hypothetical protein